MATPERDTVYNNDTNRTVYTRESNGTGWFVGIIVALALLAIGYLVFSANSGPSTTVDVNNTPAVETTAPLTESTAPATEAAPLTEAAPATDAAPAAEAPAAAPAAPVETAPAADTAAPATPAT